MRALALWHLQISCAAHGPVEGGGQPLGKLAGVAGDCGAWTGEELALQAGDDDDHAFVQFPDFEQRLRRFEAMFGRHHGEDVDLVRSGCSRLDDADQVVDDGAGVEDGQGEACLFPHDAFMVLGGRWLTLAQAS
ncbi:hypothetical protein ABT072_28235 [Streptomyces sp. NPDC002589]|uniref:hypothetical protein n=1 Tax=Streptomyces sp. NPDC002589 TaxID=3154420 RepID=UPI00332E5B94